MTTEDVVAVKFGQHNGVSVRIQKLYFKNIRGEHFDNGPDLSRRHTILQLIVQERDNIEEFDRPFFHAHFLNT